MLLHGVCEKDALPQYCTRDEYTRVRRAKTLRRHTFRLVVLTVLAYALYQHFTAPATRTQATTLSVDRLRADHGHCAKLRSVPKDPSGQREANARYVDGPPVLIKNASIWTGEPAAGTTEEDARKGKGFSWINADVFLDHGLIKQVADDISVADLPDNTVLYSANGRRMTAGIIDMHSHAGDNALPDTIGGVDDNELSSDTTPYVRSIDGINPMDPQIGVIKSGGVTTSLILPGSGNNMGGEAFVIKLAVGKEHGRPELSLESLLASPESDQRYMKMACGENAKRVYGRVGRDFGPFSRLGEAWEFRHAFEQASKLVAAQDDWCDAADSLGAQNMQEYLPMDLRWESLGAVLRGQVFVNTHCYTAVDLESFVHHSNEFKFSVRAFHHAHQTPFVPEVLKRAYGNHTPAAALFADNMYYKVEAYVATEQAGKILYENDITPVYVSDNPVINAQHVVFEAAKAYRNGLPYHAAMAGVTTAPAALLGLGERIGKVKPGFDADVVIWDSDPLSVGAAPSQVWIDGVPQFEDPVELVKPVAKALKPVIDAQSDQETPMQAKNVVFTGVTRSFVNLDHETLQESGKVGVVVVTDSRITCAGDCVTERTSAEDDGAEVIVLKDGHIAPPFTAFGSQLGLEEIMAEPVTNNGEDNDNTFSSAADGLAFETKNLYAAFRHGVTRAISAPAFKYGGHKGLSAGFKTGAHHRAEKHALFAKDISLHYTLTQGMKDSEKTPSISSAVGELRRKLMQAAANSTEKRPSLEEQSLEKAVSGKLPLVVTVHSADTIASLLALKADVEEVSGSALHLVILGGAESYMLADELAAAKVSVVLAPLLSYGQEWEERRALTGAPMTDGTAIDVLHAAGVKLAIGTNAGWIWETRDLDLAAGIAYANGNGKVSEKEALGFISHNIYDILGIEKSSGYANEEWVLYEGHPLEIEGRVKAVADGRGSVHIWS